MEFRRSKNILKLFEDRHLDNTLEAVPPPGRALTTLSLSFWCEFNCPSAFFARADRRSENDNAAREYLRKNSKCP